VKEAFSDISKTVRAFGLSQERASLVFLGFQQILSKGVVSMQELRQQIGEQLPTAIPIAQKALKVLGSSFTNLDDAVKSGTLSAKEFVPVFSRLLREDVESSGALEASLNTITASQQRFTSTLQLLTIRAFQAGGKKGFVSFFDNMTKAAENLTPLFRVIGKVVGATMSILGGALRAISILITPLHILADAFTDLFVAMGESANDKTFGFFDVITSSIKALIGILLIPLALIEEIIVAFESLRGKLDFGTLGGLSEIPGKFADAISGSVLPQLDAVLGTSLAASGDSSSRTTNSGNNITINVEGGDSGVVDQISDFFQDMFSTATPSN
jgi:tape measure domain-containing protein